MVVCVMRTCVCVCVYVCMRVRACVYVCIFARETHVVCLCVHAHVHTVLYESRTHMNTVT